MLRQGAAYHGIGYQTYLQWLVEEGLRIEASYYGWVLPKPIRVSKGPTGTQKREIERLMRVATRRKA